MKNGNEVRGYFHFYWSDGKSENKLNLHNRTLEEAMKIAIDMGYKPFSWYRPSTWNNHYTRFATDKD